MKKLVITLATIAGLSFIGGASAATVTINLSNIAVPPQDTGPDFGDAYGLNGLASDSGIIGDGIEDAGGGIESDTSASPNFDNANDGIDSLEVQGWFGLDVIATVFAESITGVVTNRDTDVSEGLNLAIYQLDPGDLDVLNTTAYTVGAPLQVATPGDTLAIALYAGVDYLVRVWGTVDGSASDPIPYKITSTVSSVDLSEVPVPAAVWLFGTALVGLMGFRRKQQKGSIAA